jgi:uncharacterized protein (TIGR00725 family)
MGVGSPEGVVIGVIGQDGSALTESAVATANQVGRLIAEGHGILVSGGLGGIMEAASHGASLAGGTVVGLLPGNSKSEANEFVTIPLATGLKDLINPIVVRASDAIIMISGDRTTMQCAIVAYGRKPLIVIEGTGGWSDRIRQALYEGQYFDERKSGGVVYVSTAEEAVSRAFEMAKTFQPKEGLTIAKVVSNAKDLPDPS